MISLISLFLFSFFFFFLFFLFFFLIFNFSYFSFLSLFFFSSFLLFFFSSFILLLKYKVPNFLRFCQVSKKEWCLQISKMIGLFHTLLQQSRHSAVEKKYRMELNSQIAELKNIVPTCSNFPSLNKVEILRKTAEYVMFMQQQTQIRDLHMRQIQISKQTSNYNSSIEQQMQQLRQQQLIIENQQKIIQSLTFDIEMLDSGQQPVFSFLLFFFFFSSSSFLLLFFFFSFLFFSFLFLFFSFLFFSFLFFSFLFFSFLFFF